MCLTIKDKFSEPLIASEDMVVYKVVVCEVVNNQPRYSTLFQSQSIGYDRVYRSKLTFNSNGDVEVALHSFRDQYKALELITLHKKITNYQETTVNSLAVVRCQIPTGSKYYIGNFMRGISYASDHLIYKEIVDIVKV